MADEDDRHPSRQGMTGSAVVESALRTAVAWIVEEVHPLQIILFGSMARGEQGGGSDVDLLIVMPKGTHKRQTAQRLYRALRGLPVPVDLLVTTEKDLARHKENPGLIYRSIVQEGRRLYGV
ncbi:MAG TPA: nucleotidyltransferase domain-containing protein [Sedimentisphaerales bacterium]|nr:nucleotidyltransferase domain-containing protein [Sedimentisphaerales bacterium]HRS09724.1 nucleotidyltransferase domain-containing protein [Sedimentisphaerales bacterium]HRV46626.1 nucleotidyltransferase domain-containing protein [Sedimentisphaerales bacterium]